MTHTAFKLLKVVGGALSFQTELGSLVDMFASLTPFLIDWVACDSSAPESFLLQTRHSTNTCQWVYEKMVNEWNPKPIMDFSGKSWSFLQRTFIQSQAGRLTPFTNEDTEVQREVVTGSRSHIQWVAELIQDSLSRSLLHALHWPWLPLGHPDPGKDWKTVLTVSSHDLPKSTGWCGPSPSRANSKYREIIWKGALES